MTKFVFWLFAEFFIFLQVKICDWVFYKNKAFSNNFQVLQQNHQKTYSRFFMILNGNRHLNVILYVVARYDKMISWQQKNKTLEM